jgi:hypothetical protein
LIVSRATERLIVPITPADKKIVERRPRSSPSSTAPTRHRIVLLLEERIMSQSAKLEQIANRMAGFFARADAVARVPAMP